MEHKSKIQLFRKDLDTLKARGFGMRAFMEKKYYLCKKYGLIPMDDEPA
jgi:hypothetical protein